MGPTMSRFLPPRRGTIGVLPEPMAVGRSSLVVLGRLLAPHNHPQAWDFVEIYDKLVVVVRAERQGEAQAMLEHEPAVMLSPEAARRLASRDIPGDGIIVLLRGVVLNEHSGGFTVRLRGRTAGVHHGCMGAGRVPRVRTRRHHPGMHRLRRPHVHRRRRQHEDRRHGGSTDPGPPCRTLRAFADRKPTDAPLWPGTWSERSATCFAPAWKPRRFHSEPTPGSPTSTRFATSASPRRRGAGRRRKRFRRSPGIPRSR